MLVVKKLFILYQENSDLERKKISLNDTGGEVVYLFCIKKDLRIRLENPT